MKELKLSHINPKSSCCDSHHEHHEHQCSTPDNKDHEPTEYSKHSRHNKDHEHFSTHTGSGCGCSHAPAQEIDFSSLSTASDTCAVYRIVNMDCPMEEALIRKKFSTLDGIDSLEFNLMQRVLTVHHSHPNTDVIVEALKSIDMIPEDIHSATPLTAPSIPWKKLSIAGILAAFAEIFHLIIEWQAMPFGIDVNAWSLTGFMPLLLSILAITLSGVTTYKKGWLAISNKNLNINALMSVAVTGAVLIGHYPEGAMVMVLFNISEAIEAKALDRARNAIKDLLDLAPETVTILDTQGNWIEVPSKDVTVGTRVRVRPGERIGLDGVILSGHSTINQAPITGESIPVEKSVGHTVYTGTINEAGSFEFEVRASAKESTLARIIHAVEEAQGSRAPIQRFVDNFASYYTPAVFVLSFLTAIIPPLFLASAWDESIYTALVLLVIACPCALVISTPVSVVSGMAAATRYGILIKGGVFLEQGRLLRTIALDKTGTLTYGKPYQTDYILCNSPTSLSSDSSFESSTSPTYPNANLSPEADMPRIIALSLASRSDHPVSKAIASKAYAEGIKALNVDNFTAVAGQGIHGVIDGKQYYLGNQRMVKTLVSEENSYLKEMSAFEAQGKSVVALIGGDKPSVQALFAVTDILKESSIEAIKELKRLGVKTIMLTGDNAHSAQSIAKQVGIDEVRSELLPEDKMMLIEQLSKEGDAHNGIKVGMVGDGINDAPALAKAHIGFAMAGTGTDTAIETADVALMDDDLRKIPRFIRISKATYGILIQNIILALGIKALFFALTFVGLTTMWMAVFADVGTALLVVLNGLRATRL